ncbi:hypothetical protein FB45DRAFT_211567 [Roridomyces roridus]|uniref:F-box domain-containing protein n=1 Tax=Roridomyces roridus TaxID=1738132 RepID=A0AAD7CGK2_9AGAR|nr:hypothetical protein FB45DRAFT_211567 [Roridomyces roridus]
MHPALAVAELVELVCENLKEPEGDNLFGCLGTLASLAVTSRAFQEPALDALWSSHSGIHNIIKCLPSHLWEVRADTPILASFTRFTVHIIGPIEADDWNIALSYSRRIKRLFVGIPDGVRFPDVTVFGTTIATLPSSQRLCPNLRFLDWGVEAETHLPYMNLFLSPRIKDISITISRFDIPIPSDLALQSVEKLRVLCPNAEGSEAYILCRSACDIIEQLDRIERLCVPNLDGEALQHLSSLQSLKVLNLDYGKVPFLSNGETPLCPGFSALRRVHFSRALPDFVVNFLKLQSSGCVITEFITSLVPGHTEEEERMWTVFAAMNTHLPSTSLKKVVVSMATERLPGSSYVYMPLHVGNINDLIPLFSFHNLTTAHLTLPVVSQIDDAMAIDMAVSWPKLKELVLMEPSVPRNMIRRQPPPPRMTLNALLAFATHCRDLERLALQVDGAAPISAPIDNHFPEPQLALRKFHVGLSRIGSDVDSVAQLLGRLFSKLSSIQFTGDGFGLGASEDAWMSRAGWKTVQKLLWERKHV